MGKAELLKEAEPLYTEKQLSLLSKAIDLATKAHLHQKRESGEPYVTHPITTAETLVAWGMDINSVIAGVLHDTVEDTDVTLEEVEKMFGKDVAKLVDGVTKVSKASAEMENLENYLPKTKDNLSKLLIAVGRDVRVLIIKLADRLHNLNTLKHVSREKQAKVGRESLEVFGPLADRLGMGQVRTRIEELSFNYLHPMEFKKTQILMKKRLGKSTRKLGRICVEVEAELKKHGIKAEINGRVKGIYSLYKKLAKVHGNMDDIYDLMALRIIVNDKEECYRVLGILHSLYKPMIHRIKDYISTPKPNGYQSLHTTVITPNEQIVEFQIRTYAMHEYAERGLAASFHYHDQKDTKNYVDKRVSTLPGNLQWISQLQEIASRLLDNEVISKNQLDIDIFGNRIFVHSPKGDIYDLPEGALPLDFAYLVHSDIGKHAYSFKVNGKIHAFDKPLKNGDVIEVVTRKMSLPKPSWTKLVVTSHARGKIQTQLRQLDLRDMITNAANNIIQRGTKNRRGKK